MLTCVHVRLVILSYECYVVYACDEYCEVSMNVLDLNVYMDVLYTMCAMCIFFNSSCAGYTVFCKNRSR
jgi:hypothetical protein